eukprot:symbB.v1.2.037960.t1/scaffold5758.1/size23924/2
MWQQRLSICCVEIWFNYFFPLILIGASFLRPNTVASGVFVLLAFIVLVLPACGNYKAWHWRRLHLAICLLCGSLFISAATLLILCRQKVLRPDALSATKLLFLGAANCHVEGNLFPETLTFGVALLTWIFGCYAKRVQDAHVDAFANPLRSTKRLVAVTLILFCSASLDFNLFALVYHIATVLIVLCWAHVKLSRLALDNETGIGLACLRFTLLAVCSLQVWSVTIYGFPWMPRFVSAPVGKLLALEASFLVYWQNIASFLLIQLLIWPAWKRKESLPTTQECQTTEQASFCLAPKSAEDQACSSQSEEQYSRTDSERDGLRASAWRSFEDKVSCASGRALLPLFSMMFFFMVWPSLMTLPLLLGAFSLHHIPVHRFPIVFFYAVLVYEMICYNMSCNMSEMPLSRVPDEFTWLERAGFQCYLRKGPGDPEVRRYVFALGQGLAILATAACARSRSWKAQHRIPALRRAGSFATSALVRKVVAFSRPLTISFVVLVVLGQNPPNLFGLLYLLWLLGLAICGSWASYITSGLDPGPPDGGVFGYDPPVVRMGRSPWKRIHLAKSGDFSRLEVMETTSFDFPGLQRSSQTVLEATWAHLTIGILAGCQSLAMAQKVQIPAMFVDSNSALAWFLWIAGIFIEMGLMLNYVMMKPLTIDSFFILIILLAVCCTCFLAQRALERNGSFLLTSSSSSLLLADAQGAGMACRSSFTTFKTRLRDTLEGVCSGRH